MRLLRILLYTIFIFIMNSSFAQTKLLLQVLSSVDSLPIEGATITWKGKENTVTDSEGYVALDLQYVNKVCLIKHVAYHTQEYLFKRQDQQIVYLSPNEGTIEAVEVISTGYFKAPKERLSGSFTHIDNKLLNRSPSPNLLDRLEGITNGLQFDRGALSGEQTEGSPTLRIRGASTLISDARPLIIVDDFPFEGDIRSINANDVESVTLLKDASAASIWGAKAGNGVIVINMKKGALNQKPSIAFQSNFKYTARPDLFYNQNVVNPVTVMDFQKALFEKKSYTENSRTVIPVYVEWLIKKRDNKVTGAEYELQEQLFKQSDLRRDISKFVYQPGKMQQYSLQLRGGEKAYYYNLSAGYEGNRERIVGHSNKRYNISFQNGFELFKKLNLETIVRYNREQGNSNDVGIMDISNNSLYLPLIDDQGHSLPIIRRISAIRYAEYENAINNGLLDWMYRPIDELRESKINNEKQTTVFGANLNYKLPWKLQLRSSYFYSLSKDEKNKHYSDKSFYVRDLINTYTQQNGTKIIPEGDILLDEAPTSSKGHNLRVQLDYSNLISNKLQTDILLGMEGATRVNRVGVPFMFVGYDPITEMGTSQNLLSRDNFATRPFGLFNKLPIPYANPQRYNDRSLSAFSNIGLSWMDKYNLNGSWRWDGSNLLGAKTNARGVALWSIGGSWNLHQENFFEQEIFSLLKLRSTYGCAGNINRSQGHLPVIRKDYDTNFGWQYATLNSPGNPSLRWEQVYTLNTGIDWALKQSGLSGSVEYYVKDAKNLLSRLAIDPTIGVDANFMMNYASLRTKGIDFSLQHVLRLGTVKLQSNILLNYTSNKVLKVEIPAFSSIFNYFNTPYYKEGSSVDLLYSIPTAGLNPENGSLLIYDANGNPVTNYSTFTSGLKEDGLGVSGVKMAPYFTSYRLGVDWKGMQLSTLLIGKFGHVMRRTSMAPGTEWNVNSSNEYHMDYYKRWQKPGDEIYTSVPAAIDKYDVGYENVYKYSDLLVVPLDYIGLQDLTLSYNISPSFVRKIGLKELQMISSVSNVGIIWKKNKHNIHPEYSNTIYPAMREYYFGLRCQF